MNKQGLKTVDIKGKAYVEVNQRIMYFRETYEQGRILTDIVKLENGMCVIKANIFNGETLVATGHAYEKEGSTFINKTSFIENCETSAIGRALGILGIGIDTSIASSEEVATAIKQQKSGDYEKNLEAETIRKAIEKGIESINKKLDRPENLPYADIVKASVCEHYTWNTWDEVSFTTNEEYKKLLSVINQELEKEKTLAQGDE